MTDKDPNELRRKRAALLEDCRKIIDTAEGEKRSLTAEENGRVHVIMDKSDRLAHAIKELDPTSKPLHLSGSRSLKEMQLQLKESEREPNRPSPENDGMSSRGSTSSAAAWRTPDGRELRVLGPKDRFQDHVRSVLPDGIRGDELSLGRMIRGLATANWRGCEAEERTLSKGGSGDFLVPETLSAQIIDRARAASVCFQAGATSVPMETGELKILKILTDPSVNWKAENADITESSPTFGGVTLRPRTLVGLCKCSVELLEDSSNASAVIEHTLARALALQLDYSILRGDGGSLQPMGIRRWPSVQVIDMGSAGGAAISDYSKFSQAWGNIIGANGPSEGLAMVTSAREAATIDGFVNPLTSDPMVQPLSVQKMQKLLTTAIPITVTHGTATNASESYVGDFSQVLVGIRTSLTVEASRIPGFSTLSVYIRAYLRADVVIGHEDWFTVIDGITV